MLEVSAATLAAQRYALAIGVMGKKWWDRATKCENARLTRVVLSRSPA
jgi:hypothetical protein